jgi:hypothetical protein
MKAYYAANKERIYAKNRKWALEHPEKTRQIKRRWDDRNRHAKHERYKLYKERCGKEQFNARARAYYAATLEKRRECGRRGTARYRKKHPEKVAASMARCSRNRLANDLNFRLLHNLRGKLWKALKGQRRSGTPVRLLGCSVQSFIIYLESLFESGMTWENYGNVWHIDHIVPCAIFDLSRQSHQERCFHFSNLQPLFAKENLRKSASCPDSHQFNLL